MKILIAEDDADVRSILRSTFEMNGCEVIEARDGQEGAEMAAIHTPDLIISDALMPKMDGFQFLRGIKQNETLQSIPFIFYSATYTGDEEKQLAFSLGAEAFIIKPKKPEDFWNELQTILEGCKLKRKSARTELITEENDYLQKYTRIVTAKLEEKVKELEKALTERQQVEKELKERVEELERFYNMAVDRELKMKQLKEENAKLMAELSKHNSKQ